jgi:hypothetical protein
LAVGWLERVEMGQLGVEVEWNGSGWAEEILILGRELGLDTLKWDVKAGLGVEAVETVWLECEGRGFTAKAPRREGSWSVPRTDRARL